METPWDWCQSSRLSLYSCSCSHHRIPAASTLLDLGRSFPTCQLQPHKRHAEVHPCITHALESLATGSSKYQSIKIGLFNIVVAVIKTIFIGQHCLSRTTHCQAEQCAALSKVVMPSLRLSAKGWRDSSISCISGKIQEKWKQKPTWTEWDHILERLLRLQDCSRRSSCKAHYHDAHGCPVKFPGGQNCTHIYANVACLGRYVCDLRHDMDL